MIRQVKYFVSDGTEPCRNLAIEEYLFHMTEEGSCILYLWRNRHTVVIGRNQNCWKECKLDLLEEEGGTFVRRCSGGGAVYHDLGNLNFTFLTTKSDYHLEKQMQVVLEAVNSFGLHARSEGRNDLVINGRKFSGNAFMEEHDRCCHHGTIMVQVDLERLSRYLKVSLKKIQSKGIDSVKSRVVNLTDFNSQITVDSLQAALLEAFGRVYGLTPLRIEELDEAEIQKISLKYQSEQWKYNRFDEIGCAMEERYLWGGITLEYLIHDAVITECRAYSDAMDADFIPRIQNALTGCEFRKEAMIFRVVNIDTETEGRQRMKDDVIEMIRKNM